MVITDSAKIETVSFFPTFPTVRKNSLASHIMNIKRNSDNKFK